MPAIMYIALGLSVVGLICVLQLIRSGRLRERYALIWLFCGVVTVITCASPGLVEYLCHLLGVAVPLNLMLFVAVVFLAGMCMMLSIVVSKQALRIEWLAKELALMKHERSDAGNA